MFSNSSHSVACVRISSLLRKQCRHNQSLGKPPIPGNWQLSFLKFKGWWNSLTLLFPSSSLSIQLIFIGCTRNKLYSFEMWSHPRFENCFCSSSQWNMIHTVTFINRKKIKIMKVQCIAQCQLPKQNTSLWVAKTTEIYFLPVLEAWRLGSERQCVQALTRALFLPCRQTQSHCILT